MTSNFIGQIRKVESEIAQDRASFTVVKGDIEILNKKEENLGSLTAKETDRRKILVTTAREIAEGIREKQRLILKKWNEEKQKNPDIGKYSPPQPVDTAAYFGHKPVPVLSQQEIDQILDKIKIDFENKGQNI